MMVIYKIKAKKTYCVTDDCIDYGGVLDIIILCVVCKDLMTICCAVE